jgi:hypothetical protein
MVCATTKVASTITIWIRAYECGTELLTSEEYKNRDRDEDVCKACWDGTTSNDEVIDDKANEAECIDCQNCGEPIDPNDARKCNVYDPRRCNSTCCDGCCVDGFSFCEHCQDGYDFDHERDLYDMLAVKGKTLPKGDACYGS